MGVGLLAHGAIIFTLAILALYDFGDHGNKQRNIGISLQNLRAQYSFVTTKQSGIASGLLMTSRFIGNILASSLYGILFASGINDENIIREGVC